MVARDDLKLHSSPGLAFAGFRRVPQPNVIATGAKEVSVNHLCVGWGYRYDEASSKYSPRPPFHLPSNVTAIRKCDHTTDDTRAWGILERLHQTWYLRGTGSSELSNIPHVDRAIPSSSVDLASVWGPAGLRKQHLASHISGWKIGVTRH
jgi:hypothetical protein